MAAVCRSEGAIPCGRCSACVKAKAGSHPDIRVIERFSDKNGKKKREIIVDQVREVISDAQIMPNESDRKVYVFREADTMNQEAQNAALKLLEEPPTGVVIVLCTTNPARLLPTVRSRCIEKTFSIERETDGDETESAAKNYLAVAATEDPIEVFRFCESQNYRTVLETTAFASAVSEQIADILCGRKENPGLTTARLFRLEALMEKCIRYLKVNVSSKQIFGLIEISTLSEEKD